MKSKLPAAILGLTPVALSAQEKINYVDHVKPVLENKCFSCHNPDKKRGDLDLTSYQGAMVGGGGGLLVHSGDPDGSKLITTTTKKAEPFMPPEGAPLTEKEIAVLQSWINGGLLETASSIAKKSAPKVDLALKISDTGKPEGPPAMPEHVLLEPVVVALRSTSVTAIAASPWAPLVAIAGNKQVLLYDTDRKTLAGIFPYTEGYLRSLKFSLNGSLLIGGGGQGGKFGNAVVWDVKTGKRVAEIGKEFDQVTSADITPNQTTVAIGSPSKRVKVYSTATGEELYVIRKHTEWVLSVQFSPDGILLASADRNGNVLVSEAATGTEFYVMVSHKVACTDLAWRSDSNILASCGEDGKIFLYEMETGKSVKNWDAHPGGALAISFTPDGRIVSVGRDRRVRTWDIQGKKLSESPAQGDIVTTVAALHDQKTAVSGDWLGNVKIWSLDKYDALGELSQNPAPLQQRLAQTEHLVPQLAAKVEALKKSLAAAQGDVANQQKTFAEIQKSLNEAKAHLAALPKNIAAKKDEVAKLTQANAAAKAAVVANDAASAAKASDSEKALVTAHGELKTLEASTPSLTEKVKPLESRLAAAQKGVSDAQSKAKAQESELAQTVAAHNQTQSLVIELKAAVFNVALLAEKENLEKIELDHASYKAALDENVQGKASDQKQLSDVNATLPKLTEQVKSLEASTGATQKEHEQAQAALAPLVAMEKAKEAEIQSANNEIQKVEQRKVAIAEQQKKVIADTRAKLNPIEARRGDAEKKIKPLEEPLSKANGQLATLQKELAALNQAATAQESQLKTKQAALAEAKGKLVKTDAAKAKPLADQIQKLTQEISPLTAQVNGTKAKVTETNAKFAKSNELKAGLEAQLKPHRAVWQKARDEEVALQNQKTEQVRTLETESANLTKVVGEKKAEIAKLQQELSALLATHAPAKQNATAKAKAASDAKANHAAALAALQTAKQKVDALSKSIPSRDSVIAEAKEGLAKLDPQLAPLRAKVKQMSEQYLAMLGK